MTIADGDEAALLGDLLFDVVDIAGSTSERPRFDLEDVIFGDVIGVDDFAWIEGYGEGCGFLVVVIDVEVAGLVGEMEATEHA